MCCRSDAVPRLSYASVEGIFVELVGASPVRRAANDVKTRWVNQFVPLYINGVLVCSCDVKLGLPWFAGQPMMSRTGA